MRLEVARMYASAMFPGEALKDSAPKKPEPVDWMMYLPCRARNVLRRNGAKTLSDLAALDWRRLAGTKNCGIVTLVLFAGCLVKNGFSEQDSTFLRGFQFKSNQGGMAHEIEVANFERCREEHSKRRGASSVTV